ncbi:MAG: hypothetical protein NZ750_11100 [Anaerolineae bacterium]|nr:hypothetical protein [Anaerolineae bacterium]MDW8171610.1 hypothetical protein [Anaerolineae bacterium]
MAEFDLILRDSGTTSLAVGTSLRLNEARPLWRTCGGLLYAVTAQDDSAPHYAALLPHRPADDEVLEVLRLGKRLAARAPQGLPLMALAVHPMQAQLLLILPYPAQTLSQALRDLLSAGQWTRTERLATQAALDAAALAKALLSDEQPRALWHWRAQDLALDEMGRLRLMAWLGAVSADPPDEAAYLHHWARLWHEAWLGHLPALPLNAYDDTRWQARRVPYLPQGVMSLGWRLVLSAAMQTPPPTRYLAEDGRFAQLGRALSAWQSFITLSNASLTAASPELLDDFIGLLPRHLQRASLRQAVWYDWLWRALASEAGADRAALRQAQDERTQALFVVRSEDDLRALFVDGLRPLISARDWTTAQAHCAQWRQHSEALARSSHSPAWQEWGHLGRWERLLTWMSAYPEQAEIAWQIGLALHHDPQDDQPAALHSLNEVLTALPDDRITRELRFEADLRARMLALRQQTPLTAWPTYAEALRAALFSGYNGDGTPAHLQMSQAMQGDNTAFFYTLPGRIAGTLAHSVEPILVALRQEDFIVARWLLERAALLASQPAELAWLERTLAPYQRLVDFLEADLRHVATLPTLFHEGLALLALPTLSSDEELMRLIERRLLTIGARAFALIQQASAARTWDELRAAYPAARLHTESVSKEALERLASLHADQPRRLDYYDTLDHYHQLYTTTRDLLAQAKAHQAQVASGLALNELERLQRARRTLELLRRAHELGLPMDNLIDSDDSTRAAWRQLLDDALRALGQLETVSSDVAQMKQLIGGESGLPARLNDLIQQVEALRVVVDNPQGESGALGVVQQLSALRLHLNELERSYQEQARALQRRLEGVQDEARGQLEVHDIQLKRQADQITSSGNLLQDARQRLGQLEQRLNQGQRHEAQLLMTYIQAMPDPASFQRIPALLDAIDGLVYALRRCPADAYDPACAQAWEAAFGRLHARFDALSTPSAKLSRKERTLLKANVRRVRAMLAECEEEARAKAQAHQRMHSPPNESAS